MEAKMEAKRERIGNGSKNWKQRERELVMEAKMKRNEIIKELEVKNVRKLKKDLEKLKSGH